MIPKLPDDPDGLFPPPATADNGPEGLLAWGGDLHPQRLLNAYRQGIFPWYSPGQPLLWWWPKPRTVIFPAQFHVSRRLLRTLRQGHYTVTADSDFAAVIDGCARTDNPPAETWIDAAMIRAYREMHTLGHAHSVEVWVDGELEGGIYGISMGEVFFGESMFSRRRDASKIALAHLCRKIDEAGYALLDCQLPNDHLYQFGARDLPGEEFSELLRAKTAPGDPIKDWQAYFEPPVDW
jgi:leucyl/phenylalanyl-tRNA--protein transferase